jgi:hypothetical protein
MLGEIAKAVIQNGADPRASQGGQGTLPMLIGGVDRGMSKVPWWLLVGLGVYAGWHFSKKKGGAMFERDDE